MLEVAGEEKLSSKLLRQQLLQFGRIFSMPAGHPLRDMVFEPGSTMLKQSGAPRKRGRPRVTWQGAVRAEAVRTSGGEEFLEDLISDPFRWKERVRACVND